MVETLFGAVMIQAGSYGLVGIFTILICGALLRGFFWNYIKVRTSFGRLVMVKIRSPLRDYFARGWVEEGFLIYKHNKELIRISLPEKEKIFYKAVAVTWIDVDDERHAIATCNYTAVSGYDAVKNNHLHTRALMRPSINSNKEKIVLVLLVVIGLISLGALALSYSGYSEVVWLKENLPVMLKNLAGTVVGGGRV